MNRDRDSGDGEEGHRKRLEAAGNRMSGHPAERRAVRLRQTGQADRPRRVTPAASPVQPTQPAVFGITNCLYTTYGTFLLFSEVGLRIVSSGRLGLGFGDSQELIKLMMKGSKC